MNSENPEHHPQPIPLMLKHLTSSPFTEQFIEDELTYGSAEYNQELMLNLSSTGIPLHAALFKTPPTSCYTPGKTIPAGYTKAGKYRAARYRPGKVGDKRAGK